MSDYSIFIAGWNAFREKIKQDLLTETKDWRQNGPSLATINYAISRIDKIPTPVSEESV